MQLSKKAIEVFKKVHLKNSGVLVDDDEANRLGIELLEFFRLIYKPVPKKDYEYFKQT